MNKAYILAICMLSASFVGCIEELEKLQGEDLEEEENELENAIYAVIEDLENGDFESFCKMWIYELEEEKNIGKNQTIGAIITLANETQIKECVEDNIFGILQVKYTINNYKEENSMDGLVTGPPIASNSEIIYKVTMDMEFCMKADSAESWECETEENDVTYYTKVEGQWIDITRWMDQTEMEESPPIVTCYVDKDSANVYHVEVVKVSKEKDLEDFSFFLRNENGSTYIAGNGFGEIAMQIIDGKEHGINTAYDGDNDQLKSRANNVSNDIGTEFPVHFSDNNRDGLLSSGDKFLVYGDPGPVEDGWKLDLLFDATSTPGTGGDIVDGGCAKLGEVVIAKKTKIGFLNPITGPLEPDAHGFWWGADQAINDLNAIYPDLNFELIEVDSGCDGAVATYAAGTLVNADVIAVVGAACSGASMGANTVLSGYGITMVSYASTNPGLSDDEAYPLFYRVVPSDAIQGPAAADMMIDAGVENEGLAILYMTATSYEWMDVLAHSVKDAWEQSGALCGAGMQGYEETTTDFAAMVTAIVDDDSCTAVYLSSYATDGALILEELNKQGFTGDVFAGDGVGLHLYEKLSNNSWATNLTVAKLREGPTYGDFESRYDANAAEVGSIKTYVLTAYDATMIVGKAFAMMGHFHENLEIVGTNYPGASGLITFLDNGDIIGAGYDICTYGGSDETYLCGKYWNSNGVNPYTGFKPQNKDELKDAVDKWLYDNDNAIVEYGEINTWDTSLITDMSELFSGSSFNGDISDWDVSSVTNMNYMFYGSSFNQDISDWDVSSVTDMSGMFKYVYDFNQNLTGWDVSSVTNMELMFYEASSLSDDNKCYIHTEFSSNDNWEYDWDEYCE